MKFKILILSCFVVMALSFNGCAIQDPSEVSLEPGESLADKLISESSGEAILKPTDPNYPATPQQSREWSKNKTTVLDDMPSKVTGFAKNPKESRALAMTESEETSQDNAVEVSQPAEEAASAYDGAAVAGGWSFELNDNAQRQMILTIFQSGDAVFGTGSIKEGDNSLVVAASGLVDGDQIYLDVTSIGTISLYRMDLTVSGDSASGDYEAFSASGDTWTGSASGIKMA